MSRGPDVPHINNLATSERRKITHIHVFGADGEVSILFRDANDAEVASWSVRTEDRRSKWGLLDDAQTLYQFVIGAGTRELGDEGVEYESYSVRWMRRPR